MRHTGKSTSRSSLRKLYKDIKMKDKSTFSFLIKYVFKKWFLLATSIICALVTVVGSLYIPILSGHGIDLVIEKGSVDFDSLKLIIFQALIVIAITIVAQLLLSLCVRD